jgi:predicted O-methyltransferase YrrM
MTLKPNSFVPDSAAIRQALSGLSAADVVMLLRQCLELRGHDHAIAIAEALPDGLRSEPSVRLCEAVARFVGGELEAAEALVSAVLSQEPDHLLGRALRGEMLGRMGRRDEALAELGWVATRYPDYPGLQGKLSVLLMPGSPYREVLAALHRGLSPRHYLEIGVETGGTLSLATTAAVAIGVDPEQYAIDHRLPAAARVVHMKSDDFFAQHRRQDLFADGPVDLAFIDGMHLFEYALRDFVNVESWCTKDATIVLHDCLPILNVAAERERRTRFWVGDTWKVVMALARYRPDLRVRTVLTPPSGLVVVRGLDPSSQLLRERLSEVTSSLMDLRYERDPGEWPAEFNVVSNSADGLLEALS